MPTGQQLSHQAPSSGNGASTPHDLFVLSDEQILEIEPEAESDAARDPLPVTREKEAGGAAQTSSENAASESNQAPAPDKTRTNLRPVAKDSSTGDGSRFSEPSAEPPLWLAAQMKDPWSGEEARELWNGVLQARSEAAAYHEAFATPEDARALKELYPGGVNEARAAVSRARLLDEIDRAYFGAPGGSADQTSAARAELAQQMLREDPAAFREMVFAGLRALEETEKGSGASTNASNLPRLAKLFGSLGARANAAPPGARPDGVGRASSSSAGPTDDSESAGLKPSATQNSNQSPITSHDSLASAYAAFEKAANEDLERSVGTAIAHTIEQALPNLGKDEGKATVGARNIVPLQERLGAAVRQDVEAALKGDRQLGEQIGQILSARRFDNETRALVVRLIDDRARQLVPSAAKRVINDWTQATLAAHRGNVSRADVTARREVEAVAAQGSPQRGLPAGQPGVSPAAFSQAAHTRPGADLHRNASRSDARRLDYRKLSDEQILEL